MGLDPTARESNFRDSIKKYCIDNIGGTESIQVLFDIGLSSPNLRNKSIEQWVSVNIGPKQPALITTQMVTIHCCQRKDPEGFKLAQLVDKVLNYFSETTNGDGVKRIPFYQSFPKGTPWVLLGALSVYDFLISGDGLSPDETKFKTITIFLKWPAKV